MPEMLEIKSRNIKKVGYDADTRRLYVEFHSGRIFSYTDVEPEKFEGLKAAHSAGRYFHTWIRPLYKARKEGAE